MYVLRVMVTLFLLTLFFSTTLFQHKSALQKNLIANGKEQRGVLVIVYVCDLLLWSALVPSLWSLLKSEFCQLASLAVPQLLHALSLSHGADIFWKLVDNSFNNKDWKIRFEAGQIYLEGWFPFLCWLA